MLIEIDRVNITLHGISAALAEEAVNGLGTELRRRLGALRGSVQANAVPALQVGRLDLGQRVDAIALRQLIAERLLDALLRPPVASVPQEGD
jgi:hypothetical protein